MTEIITKIDSTLIPNDVMAVMPSLIKSAGSLKCLDPKNSEQEQINIVKNNLEILGSMRSKLQDAEVALCDRARYDKYSQACHCSYCVFKTKGLCRGGWSISRLYGRKPDLLERLISLFYSLTSLHLDDTSVYTDLINRIYKLAEDLKCLEDTIKGKNTFLNNISNKQEEVEKFAYRPKKETVEKINENINQTQKEVEVLAEMIVSEKWLNDLF